MISGLFVAAAWRTYEEAMAASFAEPTPYVQKVMESEGWRFAQSAPYAQDGDGWKGTCLLAFNPKGELAYKADAEAPEYQVRGGEKEYMEAKRAAVNTIPYFGAPPPWPK